MADTTKISWAEATFNPWIGCTEVSNERTGGGGCDNCYARDLAHRHGWADWGDGKPRHRTSAQNWSRVRKWNREGSRWVFCASLADVFDNEVPDEWRFDLWRLIDETENLRWMLLTKRVSNLAKMLPLMVGERWPHVGFMISVVNQQEAERDIPRLLRLKASLGLAWVGLSCEPLLGPIDLTPWLHGLDFVICGGESGPRARPMHPDWARCLRDDCVRAGIPFHFKQWGEWAEVGYVDSGTQWVGFDPEIAEHDCAFDKSWAALMGRVGKKAAGRLLDGKEHLVMPRVYDAAPA